MALYAFSAYLVKDSDPNVTSHQLGWVRGSVNLDQAQEHFVEITMKEREGYTIVSIIHDEVPELTLAQKLKFW